MNFGLDMLIISFWWANLEIFESEATVKLFDKAEVRLLRIESKVLY